MCALWTKPASIPAAEHIPDAEPLTPAQARVRNPGRRFAQIVKLRPEYYNKYKEVHAAVWPEVLKQIKNCNIRECTYYHFRISAHTQHTPSGTSGTSGNTTPLGVAV